ncbi:MAG: cobalamin-dependent protein, partial [Melioribacteraceae bacterium]
MKILMVYPMYPDTFWSFKHALKFVSKKASFPPLGLLTVGSMLPKDWDKKLVDMNVNQLEDKDIQWADFVFISAMSIQSESANDVIQRCKKLNAKIVAGGPLFTSSPEYYQDIDHLVLNEAEITLPLFLNDLRNGSTKQTYTSEDWANVTATPLPLWELISMNNYTSMNIQYSRGCP